jgi:alpha-1,3-rhamnosyl/mannosyltransferase
MPFDGPALTTVHDLSWLSFPEAHPVERVRFLEKHLPETLARADLVLTDSEFIAAEIASRFALPRTKIRAIPLGVDAAYRPRTAEEILATLAKYGLEHSAYLLVVATLEPRKNLARLVRAYAALPTATKARHPLVIVGGRGWLNHELEQTIAPLEASGIVRRLGYVGESELPQIYAGAHAFAFPSLYEGFGLPVLEAMASGVPVVTSRLAPFTEYLGDDDVMWCDPFNQATIAEAMSASLDARCRERLVARGLHVARRHNWRTTAQAHLAVYDRLREAVHA